MLTKEELKKQLNNDYPLIPLSKLEDEAREIAVRWGDEYFPGIALTEKHKLASDIMNYARRQKRKAFEAYLKSKYSIAGDLKVMSESYKKDRIKIDQFLKEYENEN